MATQETATAWVAKNRQWTIYMKRSSKYNDAKSKPFRDKVVKTASVAGVSRALLGLDFAIIGGHAVSIHGHPRTTEDIDLLIDPESMQAAVRRLGGKRKRPLAIGGQTVEWNGIDVDLVCPSQPWVQDVLAAKQQSAFGPVVSKPGLVLMKLWASRGAQEDLDMMYVIKGMTPAEVKLVRRLVAKYLPGDVADLKNLIAYSRYVK